MWFRYERDERERFAIYKPNGELFTRVGEEDTAARFVKRENQAIAKKNGVDYNMNENERNEKRVQPVSLGGFTTTTVRLSTGWVGQISAGSNNSVWDSEPFEDKDEALKAANDKLNEKLKGIFA